MGTNFTVHFSEKNAIGIAHDKFQNICHKRMQVAHNPNISLLGLYDALEHLVIGWFQH